MRIGLFVSCLNDTVFPAAGRSVVTVLRRLGHTAEFPAEEISCGRMHSSTGFQRQCQPLVGRFLAAFDAYDAVVVPSASCAAMVRDSYPYLDLAAGPLASRVFEFSELLVGVLGVTDVGAYFPHRVTYHPTCHSQGGLRVGDRPSSLLRAVRGLQLAELPPAQSSCGFGGTFPLKNAATPAASPIGHVLATAADVVCAVENSCPVHVSTVPSHERTGIKVMHLADILARTKDSAW